MAIYKKTKSVHLDKFKEQFREFVSEVLDVDTTSLHPPVELIGDLFISKNRTIYFAIYLFDESLFVDQLLEDYLNVVSWMEQKSFFEQIGLSRQETDQEGPAVKILIFFDKLREIDLKKINCLQLDIDNIFEVDMMERRGQFSFILSSIQKELKELSPLLRDDEVTVPLEEKKNDSFSEEQIFQSDEMMLDFLTPQEETDFFRLKTKLDAIQD